jgi:hypothetical protein
MAKAPTPASSGTSRLEYAESLNDSIQSLDAAYNKAIGQAKVFRNEKKERLKELSNVLKDSQGLELAEGWTQMPAKPACLKSEIAKALSSLPDVDAPKRGRPPKQGSVAATVAATEDLPE